MGKTRHLIRKNYSLRHLNTFGIAATARQYTAIVSEGDLPGLQPRIQGSNTLILGGGSNLILPDVVHSLVLHNQIRGARLIRQLHDEVIIEAGGGMNWHELVLWSLQKGLGGLENLALIPGTVGAAPVQNIGAYGVELKDRFESLRAFDLQEGKFREFEARECDFAYRHSIFKTRAAKGRYLITKVRLKLTNRNHQLNTSYGAINSVLQKKAIPSPTPADIAGAVIEIRRAKLPDWRQLGNAGSFFKNPIIPRTQFEHLQEQLNRTDIPAYPAGPEQVKLPAGWLIDQCGWKGQQRGAVGCYEKQALVIVNIGGATGAEILAFSKILVQDVQDKFGITLQREVNALAELLSE